MNENATLYKKLAAVMGGISRVPKNGINQHFRYKFAQDSDVLDVVRSLLAEQSVAVFVSMTDLVQDGKITRATFEYTLACGDTGATITTRWTGEAADSQDKGINKAATAALKYWLLKTFLISTGDEDPDAGPAPRRPAATEPEPAPEPPPQPAHWATNGGGVRIAAQMNELGLSWSAVADKIQPGTHLTRMSDTTLTEAEFAARLTSLAAPPPEPPPPAAPFPPPPEAPDASPETSPRPEGEGPGVRASKSRPSYGAPPSH